MIEFKTGDIFTEDTEALVNSVNCVGVMGRGLALQFKNVFPENFKYYAAACKHGEVKPGKMCVFETGCLVPPKYIINFPTKRHWRGKSRMQDIQAGLVALTEEIRSHGIRSIAIPPLGSGLGGLDWPEVCVQMQEVLRELDDVRVVVFKPDGKSEDGRANRSSEVPDMTAGRAVLVGLMDLYLRGLLDPFVTLLEVHKLMYFMQAAGEPLKLRYKKGPYGPYAENLGHVLKAIEGHLISGYADGGDKPDKELELVPGALDDARAFLKKKADTQARFERVSNLIKGFESSFGLELLSTVHWVVDKDKGKDEIQTFNDLVQQAYAWNRRKQQFSRRQIGIAFERLKQKNWLENLDMSATP